MNNNKATKVYTVRHREGDEWLIPIDKGNYDLLIFDGKPRARTWQPIRMKRYRFTEDGRFLGPCDFPCGSGGSDLPMTNRARQKIGVYLEKYGEFLPLECADGDFCTFHVTHFVDALNERASDVLRSPDDPNVVLMIHKHVFRPDKLTDDWMFKLPQSRGRGEFYVTDPFVHMIRASGLTGLEFRQVWPQS
jgi:hypothetical protein